MKFIELYSSSNQDNFLNISKVHRPALLRIYYITSISCPTFRTPLRILPPATPPLRSLTSHPGLFTSKDLITIKRGSSVKSRNGTGIFFVIYSQSTYENRSEAKTIWDRLPMLNNPSLKTFNIKTISNKTKFYVYYCLWNQYHKQDKKFKSNRIPYWAERDLIFISNKTS